jgi:hypothetical protein
MTDIAPGGAPAPSPTPSAPAAPPASTGTTGTGPRPSAPLNPRSVGHSPSRDTHARLREAQDRAPGEAPPTPAADEQQPPADAGPRFKVGRDEISEQELADLRTRQAADAVRKAAFDAALPNPDSYRAELPSDFKPPAGLEFKIDTADPAYAQFKQLAHELRLPQEAFSKFLGIKAGMDVGTQASIDAARTKEVAKLGGAGPARIDNVTRMMDGYGLGALKPSLVTAAQVEALEAHFARLETQGAASFSQKHRVAPPSDDRIPGYESMSFEQRRFAQDTLASRRGR